MQDHTTALDTAKELDSDAIRAELEQILANQTFRPAEAQKRFLRYVVEQALEGRPHQIKEFAIERGFRARKLVRPTHR